MTEAVALVNRSGLFKMVSDPVHAGRVSAIFLHSDLQTKIYIDR